MPHLSLVTLLVREYDEAVTFYVDTLGFELVEDVERGGGTRWVVVRPRGAEEAGLLLARATTDEQRDRIGDQTGGRVGFFVVTEDFSGAYARLRAAGVRFDEEPRYESYGVVAVFQDLYGNRFDLIQPSRP